MTKISGKDIGKMKKIALLLALVLCFSCLAGVAAFADTAEKTALKAPDIAYANVSITTNVALLFAVPMDGFTVNADGTADGLFFYEILARECGRFLKENGAVYFEIGHDQGEAVKGLLDAQGFIDTKVIKDLAGNDRVVCGTRNPLE